MKPVEPLAAIASNPSGRERSVAESESGPVGELSVLNLQTWISAGDPLVVLDVREDHEREYARIALPASIRDLHIPLGQLSARVDEVEDLARGVPLVVYCHHGQRSMVAATWLASRGLRDLRNLDGGIHAWSIRVDPTVPRY